MVINTTDFHVLHKSLHDWNEEMRLAAAGKMVSFEEFQNDQVARGRIIGGIIEIYNNPEFAGKCKFALISVIEQKLLSRIFDRIEDAIAYSKKWYQFDPIRREVCIKKDLLEKWQIVEV